MDVRDRGIISATAHRKVPALFHPTGTIATSRVTIAERLGAQSNTLRSEYRLTHLARAGGGSEQNIRM